MTLAAASTAWPLKATAKPRLVLNSAFGPPMSSANGDGFFDLLMSEAFARLGIGVSVDRPPAERALINANTGVVDGDGPRIAHIDSIGPYYNLIRVPEKIVDVEFVAFTDGRQLPIAQWEDLERYNVGIVRGWKILERNTISARSVVKIKTADLLFRMLKIGRVDVVVIDRWSGLAIAKKVEMRKLLGLDPPLAVRPMYLYLHRKHADIVAPIARTISDLKADGTYHRLLKQCFDIHIVPWGTDR